MKRLKFTKPDIFVFSISTIVGALVSSDETSNLLLNFWHGSILGVLFLGMFKFFKHGLFRLYDLININEFSNLEVK
jgi:hypothetical protein